MMNTKVVICIPTFNAQEMIRDTINSLINQSYDNIIIKVVDNCSTDNTRNIVREFLNENIKLIENEINIGAEGNFSRCMQLGEDGYIAIYHADDIYEPTIVEEQVKILDNSSVLAVATHSNIINEKGETIGERFFPKELKKGGVSFLNHQQLLSLICRYGNVVTCPSVMVRSSIYKNEIKNWNGALFRTSADLDVWLRISKLGDFAFIGKPLIKYRASIESLSFNMKKVRTYRHDFFLVLDAYKDSLSRDYKKNVKFLELKDISLRKLNCIKSGGSIDEDIDIFAPEFMRVALSSRWHMKYYFISIIICVAYKFYNIKKNIS